MKDFNKIAAFVLLLVLFLPLYSWVVQVLNGLGPTNLVNSFVLKSGSESGVSDVFHMGDCFVVEAESQWADSYDLRIFENTSVILVRQDVFRDLGMEAEIRLSPSLFAAGHSYVATLDVYAYNKPILGTYFADSVASAFTVESAQTSLGFQVEYDDLVGSLHLNANLTTVDGYPLVDESVKFLLQFNTQRPTEGWVPVGHSTTNASGKAELNLAFSLADGSYRIRAVYDGSVNYGKSENLTEIEVLSNSTLKNIGLETISESEAAGASMSITCIGYLSLEASNCTPYVLLPTTATANYTVETPFSSSVFIVFFLDYMDSAGFLGSATFGGGGSQSGNPPYTYDASLIWSPSVLGIHNLIAGAVIGSYTDLARAIQSGEGIVASDEASLDIKRCPSNVVLDYPEAGYGDVLPVSVAVAKPRPYSVESTEFYVTTTLAPRLLYDGAEYVVDEGLSSVLVELSVNGTSLRNSTDEYGLAHFSLQTNFTSAHFDAVVDDSLLSEAWVERNISLRKTRVYDKPDFGSDVFQFNYSMGRLDEEGHAYIGVDHSLQISCSLLNQSIWNAPLTIIAAKAVSNATTDASGSASVPTGADYLRVHNTIVLNGDPNEDHFVDFLDAACLSAHWFPGPPVGPLGYDPDADLNRDGRVDILDSAIVGANWGKKAYRVVFGIILESGGGSSETVYLDSQGCAKIPSGARGLTVYKDGAVVGVLVEFFTIGLEKSSRTNIHGEAQETWVPSEVGRHLVQVKSPAKFDLFTTCETSLTCLDALVNLVGYFVVIKRRVDLTVEEWPAEPTLDTLRITTTARVFDVGLQVPMPDILVWFFMKDANRNWVLIDHIYSNSSGMATLTWSPMGYNVHFGLHGEFYMWVFIDQTEYTQWADNYPYVDARYKTRLEFLNGNGASMKVPVGRHYSLSVKLTRTDDEDSPTVGYKYIDLYVNGTSVGSARTEPNGIATWSNCFVKQAGVYVYRAVFDSVDTWAPREARFVVVAQVAVTNVLFDVEPHDFTPGAQIKLRATVLDATSGLSIGQGYAVRFYRVDQSGVRQLLGTVDSLTNDAGVAELLYTYPASGAYAFIAETPYGRQVSSSSGLTLTVSGQTALTLIVDKDDSSFSHTISGRLTSDGSGVDGKTIKLLVNDTATLMTTSSGGQFSTVLNLQPLNEAATMYNIQALFDGDTATAATAKTTVNGTEYTVCTTIQYGYKPASNSTTLTVEPHSTMAMQPTKTPEQLQQYAIDLGWLKMWVEFNWSYPWFRTHAKLSICLNGLDLWLHIGFNPVLPDEGVVEWSTDLAQLFASLQEEALTEMFIEVVGLIAMYFSAKGLSLLGRGAQPWLIAAAVGIMAIKFGIQFALLGGNWNDKVGMLASGIVNTILAILVYFKIDVLLLFIESVAIGMSLSVVSALRAIGQKIGSMMGTISTAFSLLRDWVDIVEFVGDAVLAAISWVRFLEL